MANKKKPLSADLAPGYRPSPSYGTGVFRRRIRLTGTAGTVYGELEDCSHGFQVRVDHKGGHVTEIQPDYPRVPFTTCSGAMEPLSRLLGCRIDQSALALNMLAKPLENCTHLLDLTLLCIAHANCADTTILYDVEVTDQVEGVSELRVKRNTELIHKWWSQSNALVWPEDLAGKPLFRGFADWANEQFEGIENEAAFVLQKGNFVSMARLFDSSEMVGSTAKRSSVGAVCYTHSDERADIAIRRANTTRDFSDTPEQLLKFL